MLSARIHCEHCKSYVAVSSYTPCQQLNAGCYSVTCFFSCCSAYLPISLAVHLNKNYFSYHLLLWCLYAFFFSRRMFKQMLSHHRMSSPDVCLLEVTSAFSRQRTDRDTESDECWRSVTSISVSAQPAPRTYGLNTLAGEELSWRCFQTYIFVSRRVHS